MYFILGTIAVAAIICVFSERDQRQKEGKKAKRRQNNLKKKINSLKIQLDEIEGYKKRTLKQRKQIRQLCQNINNLKMKNKVSIKTIKILEAQIKRFKTQMKIPQNRKSI